MYGRDCPSPPVHVGAHSVRPLSTSYLRVIENTILPFGLRAHTVRPYMGWANQDAKCFNTR